MKKIFAFILATIMVVSLVPASVFAAITNDADCPKYHTVKNCEYTELGFVEATCTTPSYTAYKCNKCGEQFADNFGTDALGHTWKDNQTKKNKNTDPVCATETNGKKYVKCSVCGYVPKAADDKNYGDGYLIVKYEHNWVAVSGVGCETLYQCSNDGCKHTKTAEHEWNFTKVTVEPKWEAGKYIAGEALFTCKECKDTKTVQILDVVCKCKSKTLVKAAVAEDCVNDGSYAIYKCDDCHQLYILVDEDYVEIDKIDSKKVIIPNKGGHKEKKDSGKLNGCVYTYTCEECKQTITEDRHPAELIETQGNTPATCTTWGYTYKLCKACGVSFVETHEPTGHKTQTKTIDPTCAKAGTIYTLCCNANCSSLVIASADITVTKDGKVYNKIVSTESIAPNDNHKPFVKLQDGTVIYDATKLPAASCDMGVVYVWQCEYGCGRYFEVDQIPAAGHKFELTTESHNCNKATTSLGAWTTRIRKTCSVCKAVVDQDYVNASANQMFASKSEAEVYHGIAFKHTDAKGKVTYSYRDGKSADSLVFVNKVPGNCTIPSYEIYTCPTCASAVYVNTGNQGHIAAPGKDVAFKAPEACDKTGVLAHSVCALCNAAFTVENGKQVTLTSTVIAAHSYFGETKETNCSKVTYWECECGKTFTDKTATKAYNYTGDAHAWKDIVSGVEATCNQAGTAKVKYCTACKVLEVNQVYRNTNTNEKVTIYLAPNGSKFEGAKITVTLTNGDKLTIEANGTVKDSKENKATLAIEKLEHTDPKTGATTIKHVGDSTDTKKDHSKVTYNQKICTFCSYEYLTDYIPATGGHVNAKGQILTYKCDNASIKDRLCVVCDTEIVTEHNFKYENDITVPATCVDEGYTYNYCDDCGMLVVTGRMAINANNHAEPVGTQANYAQNGYSKLPCAACDYAGKVDNTMKDKKGLEVLLSYDVNGHESEYAALGSIITVTVDLGSLNGVKVWGGNFKLEYNPSVLEFVEGSAAFSNEIGFNTRLATEVLKAESYFDPVKYDMVYTGKMIPAGVINVAVQADNANISIKGTKNLLTLQFKVVGAVESGYYSTQISVAKENVDFIDENGKAIAAIWNDVNYVVGTKDTDGIELVEIFDITGDGKIKMDDALDIYTYVLFNDYDAAADINADGKIDTEDLRIFYAVLTGATTIADYFKPATQEGESGSSQIQPRA